MRTIHYSIKVKDQMTGRKRVRHHLSDDQKKDAAAFAVWLSAILAFGAAVANYIGLL